MKQEMPNALRKQFLLHARKPVFQRHVDAALETVEGFLEESKNPYIAVSGGKDSSVLLHICRRVRPELDAVHLDFHTAYPETISLFETYDNLKFASVGSRLEMLEEEGMDSTSDKGKIRNFDGDRVRGMGYDGFFYGLRSQESKNRRKLLQVRGKMFYRKTDALWVCQPLSDFSYNDIWAYIIKEGLAYNALYDLMWDRPEHQQRVADFALVKEVENGTAAYLKMTHPELFNLLIEKTDEFRRFV